MPRSSPIVAAVAAAALLAGCAYPRVVSYYDEECQIMARKMVLDAAKVSVLDNCSNETCLLQVVVGAAAAATSVVVSGSIVHVGNVLYWKERNRNCKRGEPLQSGDTRAREGPLPAASAAS